jgi:hypothetical protein
MDSTWEHRDLPVLNAIVELYDETSAPVMADALARATGLDRRDVSRALLALADEQPRLFAPIDGSALNSREIFAATEPTGYARRTVGAWPTAESLADRIVAALNEAAEAEADEGKRRRLRELAAGLGGFGRDLLVEVTSGVIVKSTGIG